MTSRTRADLTFLALPHACKVNVLRSWLRVRMFCEGSLIFQPTQVSRHLLPCPTGTRAYSISNSSSLLSNAVGPGSRIHQARKHGSHARVDVRLGTNLTNFSWSGWQKQWVLVLRSALKSMLPPPTARDNPHRSSTATAARELSQRLPHPAVDNPN